MRYQQPAFTRTTWGIYNNAGAILVGKAAEQIIAYNSVSMEISIQLSVFPAQHLPDLKVFHEIPPDARNRAPPAFRLPANVSVSR